MKLKLTGTVFRGVQDAADDEAAEDDDDTADDDGGATLDAGLPESDNDSDRDAD
jgi:hypothetical protein